MSSDVSGLFVSVDPPQGFSMWSLDGPELVFHTPGDSSEKQARRLANQIERVLPGRTVLGACIEQPFPRSENIASELKNMWAAAWAQATIERCAPGVVVWRPTAKQWRKYVGWGGVDTDTAKVLARALAAKVRSDLGLPEQDLNHHAAEADCMCIAQIIRRHKAKKSLPAGVVAGWLNGGAFGEEHGSEEEEEAASSG